MAFLFQRETYFLSVILKTGPQSIADFADIRLLPASYYAGIIINDSVNYFADFLI